MTPEQVVKHFGTQQAAAKALGRVQPTIALWISQGYVPVPMQHLIQNVTRGKLRAEPFRK